MQPSRPSMMKKVAVAAMAAALIAATAASPADARVRGRALAAAGHEVVAVLRGQRDEYLDEPRRQRVSRDRFDRRIRRLSAPA